MNSHKQTSGVFCRLNASQDYASNIEIRPVQGLPGYSLVQVTSHWARARQPQEEQVRFKTLVTRDDLKALQASIAAYLLQSATADGTEHA